ncbi:type I restriction enzyme S subunit [Methylobacter tundripaludum]|uniref:Type I restriction enzyme S subunit n=1 Tax=Methylobacter tundripaludum TaxID=173365 RepID=A0A2S6HL77_9GAMM|nr:restriction endonuclease subunit S [Methylobacter tundripaludum]PPK78252.1 type I restriction enzyme S subunit [Methylobacter tundripaludum]
MIEQLAAMPEYEAYKDSGVEWLGEIPAHWELSKLGSCLKSVSAKNRPELPLLSITREKGVIPRNIEDQDENHNYIPDDLSNYKVLERGQFGMNKMKAWQGSYGVSDHTGIVSPAYFIFVFTKEIDSKFFHLAIRSRLYISYFGSASDGVRVGQWDLSKPRMKEIPFLIPSITEQTSIAAFLDCKTAQLDQAVAIKEKQIALLKERKQILIQNAVTRGLNPDAPMRDSGVEWIGEIPAHWKVKRLKFILESQGRIGFKGYTTSDLVDKNEGALTFGASHMDWDGNILLDNPVYISWKKYYESPEIMVSEGDILIVQRGSTCGKVALIDADYGPATINPSLVLLKNISENAKYVFFGIKVVLSGILNQVSQTAIPMLSQFQIDNIFITIPLLKEQVAIVAHIETESAKIDQAISIQQQQINKLKEYKATLINSAVTGKIKVA